MEASQGVTGTVPATFILHKMWLLRQAHGLIPHKPNGPVLVHDDQHQVPIELKMKHATDYMEKALTELYMICMASCRNSMT